MGSDIKNVEGFKSTGGEVPYVNPKAVIIVGLDEQENEGNWYLHDARLQDESEEDLAEYATTLRGLNVADDPIDVVRDGTRLLVIDGRRTVRAARIIWDEQAASGIDEKDRIAVRAIIRRGKPEDLFRINVDSHKKKPLTPLQHARLVLNYFNRHQEDIAKTATFFGVSEPTVKNHLALFDLAAPVLRAVDKGELPLREAVKLADMPRAEQVVAMTELQAAGATKGAALSNGIAAKKRGEKVERADKSRVRSRKLLERWLAVVKKEKPNATVPLIDVLKFVLGGNVPKDGHAVFELLAEAGFKGNTTKKKKAEAA